VAHAGGTAGRIVERVEWDGLASAGITALIIILLVVGFVSGLPGGFLLGWLVFR
jgi:hypothetical protein